MFKLRKVYAQNGLKSTYTYHQRFDPKKVISKFNIDVNNIKDLQRTRPSEEELNENRVINWFKEKYKKAMDWAEEQDAKNPILRAIDQSIPEKPKVDEGIERLRKAAEEARKRSNPEGTQNIKESKEGFKDKF